MTELYIGESWNDLQLNRKDHEHLVAVVKLTNNYTGEYFYWPVKCVWSFMRELTQLLQLNTYTRFARLQDLYNYVPDFHVELINPVHPLPSDFKCNYDFRECVEELFEQTRDRYTMLLRETKDDVLNIIGWYSKWTGRYYSVHGDAPARPELPAEWHTARQHGMTVQQWREAHHRHFPNNA